MIELGALFLLKLYFGQFRKTVCVERYLFTLYQKLQYQHKCLLYRIKCIFASAKYSLQINTEKLENFWFSCSTYVLLFTYLVVNEIFKMSI